MLENGTLVDGKYEILSKVGQGGMSVVYLAINRKAMKQWAIKEVRRDGVKDFEVVKQSLVAETDMLKKLSHPNLPDIVDIIENEDSFLIVMDYIEGNPLSKRLEETGAQPETYVVEWAKQLCDVLDYLHTREPAIIYRDMKPSNVMLKPDGQVSLIDFGTAREYKGTNIQDTTCLGTIGYAAPEQFGGQGETDARTDIYCLGATLYHLVTGHSPAEPPYEMYPIRYWNESLSPGLENIILKCTKKDPNDRYQSCAELRYALEHIDEGVYEYWVAQKKKFNLFLTSIIAMLLCFVVGITGSILGSVQSKSLYADYIIQAQQSNSAEDKINNYVKALELDYNSSPEEMGEKFTALIDAYASDGAITKEELSQFKNLLDNSEDGNDTKQSYIQRSDKAYYNLCYKAGIWCLSIYEGSNTDKMEAAKGWFSRFPEDYSNLDAEIQNTCKMAKNYLVVANFYTNAAKNNSELNSGENANAYKEMFDSLMQTCSAMSSESNEVLKYRVYQVAVNFLSTRENITFCISQGVSVAELTTLKDTVYSKMNEIPQDSVAKGFREDILKNEDTVNTSIQLASN